MRTTVKKAHLNLSINPDILTLFDSLQQIHKREYSEYFEEKLLELIEELAPDMVMELKIKEKEAELLELKTNLPMVKFSYGNIRKQKLDKREKSNNTDEADKLKQHRENTYPMFLDTFKYQLKNKIPFDWSLIQDKFRFKTKVDAEDWIHERLKKDRLMK